MSTPSPNLVGVLLTALLAKFVLTPILSLLVLRRYRRAVTRSMHASAPGGKQPARPAIWSEVRGPIQPRPRAASPPVMAVTADIPAETSASSRRRWPPSEHRTRSLCLVYVAAGVVYGLVAASVSMQAQNIEFLQRRFAIFAVAYAWPLVPTVLAVLAVRRRTTAIVWTGYLLLILLLFTGTDAEFISILAFIAFVVLVPAVLLLAVSVRNFRAVGPFLAVPVAVAAAGLSVWAWIALPLVIRTDATRDQAAVVVIVAVLLVAPIGLVYLWWSARQYAHKRASDQMLLISQWWFLATVWPSITLVSSSVYWAFTFWLAYLAFRLATAAGLRLRRRAISSAPLRLLLLRVFGRQRSSERLLGRLGTSWRHLGPVQMIAGPDLVAAALEPHEFLDSLRGKLSRQFVADPDDLRRRLGQLDLGPDTDGRYRVNELFCHDDTWRPTLHELVHRSDCILLDLRGFTVARQGVTYEITQLVELAPLRRVLVLTDETTDHGFLREVLDTAWRGISPLSPNWSDAGALRMLQAASRDGVDTEAAVALLAAGVEGGPLPSSNPRQR
jgi:hypothetical protein